MPVPPQGESMTKDESFPLRIWSGLFREKHWRAMGSAIWLFGMLLDKVTKEEDGKSNGKGYVLGGAPITYKTFAQEIPFSERQYYRYLEKLRKGGYIHTHDTHRGLQIVINKSKKFKRRGDNTVTSPPTETAGPTDRSGRGGVPKKAAPLRDYKEDYTETVVHRQQYMQIWKMIHEVFRLPEGSHGAYKDEIIETIQRLGFPITKKACGVFVENTDDHPPKGKIASISQLLHWKKIDIYVAMMPPVKKLRYYACLVCERVIQIEDLGDVEQALSLPSGRCIGPTNKPEKAHEERAYVEVTATVVDCQNRGLTEPQIRAVIDKRIKTIRKEGES